MTEKATNKRISDSIKKLSIQVNLNGLSFFIVDGISKRILLFDEIQFKSTASPYHLLKSLKELFEKHKILDLQYEEVSVIHWNDMFTLVPKSLFEPEEMANYLKFNTKLMANDEIVFDTLNNQEIHIVYVPFTNINNYVFDCFGEFEFKHQSTEMLQTVFDQKNTEKACFVHVGSKTFELAVLDGKKLLLYNQFQYQTQEDFLYYVLFTYEQLELNTEVCKLLLFGSVEEGDPIYSICHSYIKNITVFEPSNAPVFLMNNGADSIDFSSLTT